MSESPAERRLHAQAASLTHWSQVPDRTAATQAMRDGFTQRLERQVDPDGALSIQERARRVEMARKAHLSNMSRLAAKARRERAAKSQ